MIAWVRWIAVAAWAGAIFMMSSVPGSRVPGRFGSLAHFVEYAILGGLLLWALSREGLTKNRVIAAVVFASGYAISDEFHQSFVPLRTPDPVDWLVDTLGALVGVLLARAVLLRVTAKNTRQ